MKAYLVLYHDEDCGVAKVCVGADSFAMAEAKAIEFIKAKYADCYDDEPVPLDDYEFLAIEMIANEITS